MNVPAAYDAALDLNQRRVDAVTADQLAGPTPCTEWNVEALLGHLTGGYQMFAAALGHPGSAPDTDWPETHRAGARAVREAFADPSAMNRPVSLPIGEVDGHAALGIALVDAVVHGWDLAKATGQDTAIDDELAEALLEQVQGTVGPGMRPGGPMAVFADPIGVDARRPAGERLVAFLGRQP